jgi:polar amino acid transport system permease protein
MALARHRGITERVWLSYAPTAAGICITLWVAAHIKWDFVSGLDFAMFWRFRAAIIQGIANTLLLTALSVACGGIAGIILAMGWRARLPVFRWLIGAYLELFRNTPLLLQLFWIHFALPRLTGISTSPFESGFIAMSLQSSAYLADVARAGIEGVQRGQWEAAAALGLSSRITWLKIVFPQAFKIIIPPLANIAIGYFKSSAMLSLLSVGELMTVGIRIAQYTFKPIETYTIVGAIYLVLGAIFSSLTFRLEHVYRDVAAPR